MPEPGSLLTSLPLRLVAGLGRRGVKRFESVTDFLGQVGRMAVLGTRIIATFRFVPKNPDLTISQMYSLGFGSLPLVLAVSAFVGIEAVLQAVFQFSGIIPLRYLGLAVRAMTVTELVPVIISIVIAGRVATSIAAEIANMKNTEQLDSMTILALDPVRYLYVPRVLASTLMLPVLVIIGLIVAMLLSVAAAVAFIHMTPYAYLSSVRMWFSMAEIVKGIPKCALFGFGIGLVGIYYGSTSAAGVAGVGRSTAKAVTISSVLVLVFDFIVAQVLI